MALILADRIVTGQHQTMPTLASGVDAVGNRFLLLYTCSTGHWCNGSTGDSKSLSQGSSP